MTAEQPSDRTGGPIQGSSNSSFSSLPERSRSLPAEIGWQTESTPAHAFAARSGGEDQSQPSGSDSVPALAPEGAEGEAGAPKRRRRRGSRGGRRRRRSAPGEAGAEGTGSVDSEGEFAPEADSDATPSELDQAPEPSAREVEHESEAHADSEPAEGAAATAEGGADRPRRRRRRGRGRGRGRDEAVEGTPAPGSVGGSSAPRAERAPRPLRAGPRSGALPQEIGIDRIPGEDLDEDVLAPARPEDEPFDSADAERESAPAGGEFESAEGTGEGGFPRKKRRRRGSRGGRNRKRRGSEGAAPTPRPQGQRRAAPVAVFVEAIPGEEDDLAELAPLAPQLEELAPEIGEPQPGREGGGRRKRRRGKQRQRGEGEGERERAEPGEAAGDEDLDLDRGPAPVRNQLILVNAIDPEEKRVAVVENDQIVDFQMTVRTENSVVNDIYRGRVVNLEPAIGAAFVDFGQGRNGFLHTSDVLSVYGDPNWSLDNLLTTKIDPEEWDSNSSQPKVGEELDDAEGGGGGEAPAKPQRRERGREARRFRARPRLPITDLLKKGQMVCVQVTKDAIGDKGPTLTTYISIPGRYLVLMPSMARTGVSRKIEDEKERRRLKKILGQLDVPQGMGVIVRTAGVGRSRTDLKRDLDYLKGVWETFSRRLRTGHGPAPLYQESDIAIRTVRDLFTPSTEAIVIDDVEVHRQIVEFAHKLMPEDEERVKLHTGPKPLFHTYGVEPDFERVFSRRIDLPSGGSIVFDQAEALVAIDVNSGRTRTDGFDFEQIALKTNLEAAPEIARQIRLRDLGGIIVVDFIDMMKVGNMRQVERKFRESLAQDRARFKIGRISQFGLLELTRQRLGPGMNKKVFHTCPRCRGTGRIRTVESRAAAILRRLGSALTLKGFSTVEVKAHPEVVEYLKNSSLDYLRALEYRCERQIRLLDAPEQAEDSVLRYLRADGREVRPGGRRKR